MPNGSSDVRPRIYARRLEDSIERRALVLFGVTALVISFGGLFDASTVGFGEDWLVLVYIVALVALVGSLALSGLTIAPLREGALAAWPRTSLLGWAILLFVVGVGLLALVAAVGAHNVSGFDDYSG